MKYKQFNNLKPGQVVNDPVYENSVVLVEAIGKATPATPAWSKELLFVASVSGNFSKNKITPVPGIHLTPISIQYVKLPSI